MTITRALSELKLIDGKIGKKLNELQGVGLYQKKTDRILNSIMTREDFKKTETEKFQALGDLVKRKADLKIAISKANAKTKVKIGKMNFTINELIGYKETVIPTKRSVLTLLKHKYTKALEMIEGSRLRVEEQVNKMIEQNLGTDKKADPELYSKIGAPFIEENILRIADPNNLGKYLENLETEIDEFESEVNFALSEANAKTEIEI